MLDSLPWPWSDGPAPEPTTVYALYEDGTLGQLTAVLDSGKPVLSRPGRLLTRDEYETLRGQMTDAHNARLAELEAADEARQASAFRDLTKASIPEATARALSGYTGTADGV
ncbi:hypothetical protein ACWCQN_37695 [Streptomyces sp. NPDC001984]